MFYYLFYKYIVLKLLADSKQTPQNLIINIDCPKLQGYYTFGFSNVLFLFQFFFLFFLAVPHLISQLINDFTGAFPFSLCWNVKRRKLA